MLFRLGLCRNGIGVVVQAEDAFRRVRRAPLNRVDLRADLAPRLWKTGGNPVIARVDSGRARRVVLQGFEDRQDSHSLA